MAAASDGTSVRVAVRVRPLTPAERAEQCSECVERLGSEPQVVMGRDRTFRYDEVFDTASSQAQVFDECVTELVEAWFQGYNCTVFAYGQTGSGKTYTMGSGSNVRLDEEQQGIIPRVIAHVFRLIGRADPDGALGLEHRVSIQFIEIYGELMNDLLLPHGGARVHIREIEGEVAVVGASEPTVETVEEVMGLLEQGTMSRTTASTMMNEHSSRSHAIFTLLLERRQRQAPGSAEPAEERTAKFHFVDLAGSERAKRTQAEGKRLREGIEINKGLLALGNVISALGDERKRGRVHVPYRDSKLTRMLQDSLGGNSRTLMIACVSPADINFEETLNTLKYANRARNIKNKPIINRDQHSALVESLRERIAELEAAGGGGGGGGGGFVDEARLAELRARAEASEAEVHRLIARLREAEARQSELGDAAVRARAEVEYLRSRVAALGAGGEQADEEGEVDAIASHLRTIDALKTQLRETQAEHEARAAMAAATMPPHLDSPIVMPARSRVRVESFEALSGEPEDEPEDGDDEPEDEPEDDDDDDDDPEEERREDEEDPQAQLAHIASSLGLKEELMVELRKSQRQYEAMKAFYEDKMRQMDAEVRQSEAERERLLEELEKREHSAERAAQLRQALREREAQLVHLRSERRKYQSYARVRDSTDAAMRKCQDDIQALKRQKASMLRRIAADRKKHEANEDMRRREISALKRAAQRDAEALRKLGAEKQRQELVLRRRNEEMAALRRRQRAAQPAAARRRLSPAERRRRGWLEKQAKALEARELATTQLQRELRRRERIVRQMERLYDNVAAVVTQPGDRPLSPTSEAALREVEERLESCRAQVQFADRRIDEMESKSGDDPGHRRETLAALDRSVSSLPEAQSAVRLLFDMLVEANKAGAAATADKETARAALQQRERDLAAAQQSLQRARRDYDTQLTQLQTDQERTLTVFLDRIDGEPGGLAGASAAHHDGNGDDSSAMRLADERSAVLRSQVERLQGQRDELESRVSALTDDLRAANADLAEQRAHVEWLEFELQGRVTTSPIASSPSAPAGAGAAGEPLELPARPANANANAGGGGDRRWADVTAATDAIARGESSIFDRLAHPSSFTGVSKRLATDSQLRRERAARQHQHQPRPRPPPPPAATAPGTPIAAVPTGYASLHSSRVESSAADAGDVFDRLSRPVRHKSSPARTRRRLAREAGGPRPGRRASATSATSATSASEDEEMGGMLPLPPPPDLVDVGVAGGEEDPGDAVDV